MQIATGIVVKGQVVLDGANLPEGTQVTVLTRDTAPPVVLPPHLLAELEDALDEADRVPGISADQMFAELKQYS